MHDKERYAHEKMRVAVQTLATGTGAIRERLRDVYREIHVLSMEKFAVADPEVNERVARVLHQLRQVDIAGDEGTVRATLDHKLTDDECVELAKLILEIYDILHPRYIKWTMELDARHGGEKSSRDSGTGG